MKRTKKSDSNNESAQAKRAELVVVLDAALRLMWVTNLHEPYAAQNDRQGYGAAYGVAIRAWLDLGYTENEFSDAQYSCFGEGAEEYMACIDARRDMERQAAVDDAVEALIVGGFMQVTLRMQATMHQRALAEEAGVKLIDSHLNPGVWLNEAPYNVDAEAAALDELGNWTVVLPDGGTRQYLGHEVQ